MNTIIRTPLQLQQAQADAWVYGLIFCGIALAVAIAIAFLIPFRSDRKDYITRRICFVVIGIILPAGYWLYNMQTIVPKIQNPGFKSMFEETNLYVLLASIGIYFIAGILLMLGFRNTKLGSILGKKKN
jgi:membrane protease YdiL (CAAX protease family)